MLTIVGDAAVEGRAYSVFNDLRFFGTKILRRDEEGIHGLYSVGDSPLFPMQGDGQSDPACTFKHAKDSLQSLFGRSLTVKTYSTRSCVEFSARLHLTDDFGPSYFFFSDSAGVGEMYSLKGAVMGGIVTGNPTALHPSSRKAVRLRERPWPMRAWLGKKRA